jgi:hypothetical protein
MKSSINGPEVADSVSLLEGSTKDFGIDPEEEENRKGHEGSSRLIHFELGQAYQMGVFDLAAEIIEKGSIEPAERYFELDAWKVPRSRRHNFLMTSKELINRLTNDWRTIHKARGKKNEDT